LQIADIRITPIAISDPPLLNSVGLHAPYALRLITEIVSDDGIVGISEIPGGVKNETGLRQAAAFFDGHDPFDFNRLTAILDGAFTAADDKRGTNPWDQRLKKHVMSALEVACYDLIGKATGKRVAELLGGVVRERVPYAGYLFFKYAGAGGALGFGMDADATGWPAARQREAVTPEGIVAQAEALIDAYGFPSLKLKGGALDPEIEVGAMEALHKRFGPKMPLRFDPNAVWTMETALAAGKRMKGFLEYYEDPVRGQAAMAEVGKALGIPMATNMCTTSFDDLPESIRLHSEDVILSDHHFWGGFRPCLALAALCRVFGRGLSMHSNSHLGVSLMAMTHLAAATPNLTYDLDTHYPWQSEEIAAGGAIRFDEGHVRLPDAPGLGVELDPVQLASLHRQYLMAGLQERDDETEMRKLHPEFRAALVRY
jgi:glucarate dehydratase